MVDGSVLIVDCSGGDDVTVVVLVEDRNVPSSSSISPLIQLIPLFTINIYCRAPSL